MAKPKKAKLEVKFDGEHVPLEIVDLGQLPPETADELAIIHGVRRAIKIPAGKGRFEITLTYDDITLPADGKLKPSDFDQEIEI